ncbi:helix-turn-helix domain-containing protein [Alistipes putredinis]|jgi:transcriptional regulator with XRE-family HTH domain|uniref:helix-turn-helix domain-containing protein n=1 Tax=Alistipes putredinis TaxID=28117 RepID=UPI003AF53A0D
MDNEFRIAEILKSKGMTQKDLAEKIGISRVGLSKAINGNTTITTLRRISAALEVSVSELFAPQPTNTITCPKCGTVLEVKERE